MTIEKASVPGTLLDRDGHSAMLAEDSLPKQIISLILPWERGEISELKFKTPHPALLFELVKSCYDRFITAAGGLVVNERGRLLVIFRNGKWDLPKGKIEAGEPTDQGALREVKEETGLQRVTIEKEFTRTWHTYMLGGKRVLKETVWYLMSSDAAETRPQTEEGITRIEWISADELPKISANTYENILLLLEKFFHSQP